MVVVVGARSTIRPQSDKILNQQAYIKAFENQILPKQDLHNQADLDGHEA